MADVAPAFVPEIPAPTGTFEAWATWTAALCRVTEAVGRPVEMNWRAWAVEFIDAPSLRVYGFPDPAGFEDWRAWAAALKGVYDGP